MAADDPVTTPTSGIGVPIKETTTVEKVKLTGGPQIQEAPAAPAADDGIRKVMAWAVIIGFLIIIETAGYALFFYAGKLSNDVLPIVTGLVGAVFGYWANYTSTVIGYLFGSSSGSTAKQSLLNKG